MTESRRSHSMRLWGVLALLMGVLVAGCGGSGRDAVIDQLAPTVTAVGPLPNATAVPVNTRMVTAAFSEAMDPLTISVATFSLACPAGRPTTGSVRYDANANLASLTLVGDLPASTVCTATITTGAKDVAGNAVATPFSWGFSTGMAAADTTPPTVSSTFPLADAGQVASNARISASFSEAMDPLTINSASVKLFCSTGIGGSTIGGSVTYAVDGNIATLTPTSNLPAFAACTATITTIVKDVAGNALANNYFWNFSIGSAPPPTSTP